MDVTLIAHTDFYSEPGGYVWSEIDDVYPSSADELAEAAGRNCYEAWNRPNPATASNQGYLANIIAQGHFSVLEHASASFYVSGVSRSLLAELSRHRHLSLSVVSQRYVDHSDREVVTPPLFDGELAESLEYHRLQAVARYEYAVEKLMSQGHTRKEARGAARAFLPEATETAMVVTANMRAWREFIGKRQGSHVDIEIRTLVNLLLAELKGIAPNSFQDMSVEEI